MRAVKPIVILLAGMLLLLPVLDCFSYAWIDAQSCDCCGSAGCTPGDPDHECCRVTPIDTAARLPQAIRVLRAPVLVVEHAPTIEVDSIMPPLTSPAEPQLRVPPDLYTFQQSLLI